MSILMKDAVYFCPVQKGYNLSLLFSLFGEDFSLSELREVDSLRNGLYGAVGRHVVKGTWISRDCFHLENTDLGREDLGPGCSGGTWSWHSNLSSELPAIRRKHKSEFKRFSLACFSLLFIFYFGSIL